jgi:hypothetical protein
LPFCALPFCAVCHAQEKPASLHIQTAQVWYVALPIFAVSCIPPREFVGAGVNDVPQTTFPSGFYQFTRRSFANNDQFIAGLAYVFSKECHTYIRSYATKATMQRRGLNADLTSREFRGYVTRQEDGVSLIVSRRMSMSYSFNYLTRVTSFENNFWIGYATRTVHECATGTRAVRMVYEHLGRDRTSIYSAARTSGFLSEGDLKPLHRRLLQTGDPFR